MELDYRFYNPLKLIESYECRMTAIPSKYNKSNHEKHLAGKTNASVKVARLIFKDGCYVPRGFSKLFPNLVELHIEKGSLKTICQRDLDGLNNLELLSIEQNELTTLPDDLFRNTLKLKNISFSQNKIEFVSSKLFEPIMKNNFQYINFRWNRKIDVFYHPQISYNMNKIHVSSVAELMDIIDAKCSKPKVQKPDEVFQKPEKVYQKRDGALQNQDEVFQKPEKVYQKLDRVLQNQDEVFQKPEKVYQKVDEVFQKPVEVFQKPDEVFQKPEKVYQKLDEVFQKPEKVYQKLDEVFQKPDEVFQKPDEFFQKPDEVFQKPDEVLQKPEIVHQKPDEVLQKPEKVHQKPDEVLQNRSLIESLENLLVTGKFSDFDIIINKQKKFKVHKIILAARSEGFAELLQNDPSATEMEVEDLSTETVEEFLLYIYSEKLPDNKKNFMEIFALASKLNVPELKNEMEKLILTQIDKENAGQTFSLAHKYESEKLKIAAFKEIQKMFPDRNLPDEMSKDFSLVQQLMELKSKIDDLLAQTTNCNDIQIDSTI